MPCSASYVTKPEPRLPLLGNRSQSFSTPGFFPPTIWSVQRTPNDALQRKLFPYKEHSQDGPRSVSNGVAHISGKPVDENVQYPTCCKFSDLPVDKKLLDNVVLSNLTDMTPVQIHTIPLLLANSTTSEDFQNVGMYDLMAAAQTGSGKTLAYLIPILHRIMCTYPSDSMNALVNSDYQTQFPLALILAPTRELVHQIRFETSKLCYRSNVRPVGLFGGEKPYQQMSELRRGCHVVVATPGRLLDFLEQQLINLTFCRNLVIDEADRLLDMGFEPQLRKIVQSRKYGIPPVEGRQTALFSATFPPTVALLARDFLRGPRCISLNIVHGETTNDNLLVPVWGQAVKRGKQGAEDAFKQLKATVPKEIVQQIEWVEDQGPSRAVPSYALLERLVEAINSLAGSPTEIPEGEFSSSKERVLVFCNTKREVEHVDRYLMKQGFKSVAIHGGRSQQQRNHGVQLFKDGRFNVLVATSVVARGLDFPRVKGVINLGLPLGLDEYVHRIGRTGRMGQSGRAITIVSSSNIRGDKYLQGVARGICRLIANPDCLPQQFTDSANWRPEDANSSDDESTNFNHSHFQSPCPPKRLNNRFPQKRHNGSSFRREGSGGWWKGKSVGNFE
nr:DEAD box ATP dependent RNA helicase [Hymenolepis microstoma]